MIDYSDYRQTRMGFDLGAKDALHHLRTLAGLQSLDWEGASEGRGCIWEESGFQLRATLVPEDYPNLDYLGRFTARWRPGAIRHEPGNWRTLDWFVPGNIEQEHYRGLLSLKYGRAYAAEAARRYVIEDYRRTRSYGEEWCHLILEVTASRADVELGSASLSGIESDGDEWYLDQTARELAAAAITDAEKSLHRLCGHQA